ncbi:MAG: glycosyltransferase family 4 protein [Chloroflexia bacterium]
MSAKVCLVWFGSYYPGQGYTPLYEISQSLAARGWETHVITCRRPGETQQESVHGVHVHRIYTGHSAVRFVNPAFFARAIPILRHEPFELVHVFNVLGASVLPRFVRTVGRDGRPTRWVLDIQTGPFLLPYRCVQRGLAALIRAESRCFDAVLAISEEVADFIFGGERARAVAGYSRPGVRLERFACSLLPEERLQLRRHLGLDPEKVVFVYSGVLEKRRRPEDLVYAFAAAAASEPDLQLLFVGTGSRQAELERLVRRLGLQKQIVFAGLVAYADVPRYLAVADVALSYIPIHPIGHNLQPFLKTGEYLACGLPVICTDTPGHRRWIRNGYNGVLCADGPESIARAMVQLARAPELRARLRQGALDSALAWDWERILEQEVLPVYHTVLGDLPIFWAVKGGGLDGAARSTDPEAGQCELYPRAEPLHQDRRGHP